MFTGMQRCAKPRFHRRFGLHLRPESLALSESAKSQRVGWPKRAGAKIATRKACCEDRRFERKGNEFAQVLQEILIYALLNI